MLLPFNHPALHSEIVLHVIGSATPNPGPGGWAAVWRTADSVGRCNGHCVHATSVSLTMTAIVEGLRQSPPAKSVTVCTDAQFIAEAMSTGAADVWRKSNWRRPSGRGEIKNPSQWAAILDAVVGKDAAISWLHGHVAGWDWEEARSLAKQKARVLATWPHQL